MSLKWIAVAIAVFAAAVVGYGTWQQIKDPPRIISVGNVEVPGLGGTTVRLLTRVRATGGVMLSEVELPNGTWLDCSADCAGTARKATTGFWDEQQKRKK
jgi:hypothetical protein